MSVDACLTKLVDMELVGTPTRVSRKPISEVIEEFYSYLKLKTIKGSDGQTLCSGSDANLVCQTELW
jgi:hypothetical protein